MLVDRTIEAAERGVLVIVRQSSKPQKTGNIGSGYFQLDQLQHLKMYGIDPEVADVCDLRGETGRGDAERPGFEEHLDKIRAGLYGLVIATLTDRMARNQRDIDRLVDALREVDGMLIVNGRIYDPTDPNHRLILGILAQIAQHDNEMRVLRSLSSKSALAHRMELAVPLPTGLVWASPEDPAFLDALRREGLESCVEEQSLAVHKAIARCKGEHLYALPFPDAEVQQALRLLLEWLLETRHLGKVLERIERGDGGWPRPGCFPIYRSRRYDPSKIDTSRKKGDLWKRIVGRTDGRDELARGTLRDYLSSPALYGIYAFQCPGLASISRHAAQISQPVCVEGAFPGLYELDVRDEVEEILGEALDFRIMGSYDGPRHHALVSVRCASFLPDGTRCGLRKSALYRPRNRGRHRYKHPACLERGHHSDCADQLDQLVVDLVKEAYAGDALDESLRRVRQSRSQTDKHRSRLQGQLDEAEARLQAAAAKAETARSEGDRTLERVFDQRVKEHHETMRRTRRRLQELEAAEGDASVSRREKKRLLDLAADVPKLIDLVGRLEVGDSHRHEGAMRRLMKVLVTQVHVRRLGAFCHEVQVEFPSGARRRRLLFTRRIDVPQAALAYAHLALGERAKPEYRNSLEREREVHREAAVIARRMNTSIGRANLRTEWTGERVLTAALAFGEDGAPAQPRPCGRVVTVTELSDELELDRMRVLGAALRGELGRAFILDGEFHLMPSDRHLHKAFPESVRIELASKRGWPIEETVLVATLHAEEECAWSDAKRHARRSGGIVRDAAGRRWCRRPAREGEKSMLQRTLDRHLPADTNPDDGRWMPLKDVLRQFDIHRATAKKYGLVVRPGFGYLGERSVYIRVDEDFRARLPG